MIHGGGAAYECESFWFLCCFIDFHPVTAYPALGGVQGLLDSIPARVELCPQSSVYHKDNTETNHHQEQSSHLQKMRRCQRSSHVCPWTVKLEKEMRSLRHKDPTLRVTMSSNLKSAHIKLALMCFYNSFSQCTKSNNPQDLLSSSGCFLLPVRTGTFRKPQCKEASAKASYTVT